MFRIRAVTLVLAGLAFSMCRPAPPEEPTKAGAGSASAGEQTVGVTESPPPSSPQPTKQQADTTKPAGPRSLPLLLALATTAEGQVLLARDAPTAIDSFGASFRVDLVAELEDARLVLLDEQHAMVQARGETELGLVTRFTITPDPPLQPGTSYTLRLEGAVAHDIHDNEGNAYSPMVFRISTNGEKPAPIVVPTKKNGKRGKRR